MVLMLILMSTNGNEEKLFVTATSSSRSGLFVLCKMPFIPCLSDLLIYIPTYFFIKYCVDHHWFIHLTASLELCSHRLVLSVCGLCRWISPQRRHC